MNTLVNSTTVRKLPSADWIALALGVMGLVAGRFYAPLMSLMALAIFGPPLMRELGWLKDSDEYTMQIIHRAGFHTALAMALLVVADRFIIPWHLSPDPGPMGLPHFSFSAEFLSKTVVMVFLFSYLIQYWGAARGVSRILVGLAALTLIEVAVMLVKGQVAMGYEFVLYPAGIVLVLLGLAWTAPRLPRIVGGLMLILMAFGIYHHILSIVTILDDQGYMSWFLLESVLNLAIPMGIIGGSLLWSTRRREEEV